MCWARHREGPRQAVCCFANTQTSAEDMDCIKKMHTFRSGDVFPCYTPWLQCEADSHRPHGLRFTMRRAPEPLRLVKFIAGRGRNLMHQLQTAVHSCV